MNQPISDYATYLMGPEPNLGGEFVVVSLFPVQTVEFGPSPDARNICRLGNNVYPTSHKWSVAINGNRKISYYKKVYGSGDYARFDRTFSSKIKMNENEARNFTLRNRGRNIKIKMLLQSGGIADYNLQMQYTSFAADIKSVQIIDPTNSAILAEYKF